MTSQEQLERWVAGESVHRGKRPNGECCPDFSCCNPGLKWPKERREFFRDHPKARHEMLFQSLSAGVALLGGNAHITG